MTQTTTRKKQVLAELTQTWTQRLPHTHLDAAVSKIIDNLDACQCGCEGECKVDYFHDANAMVELSKGMDPRIAFITVYTRNWTRGNA